jgi:hypothetical protein
VAEWFKAPVLKTSQWDRRPSRIVPLMPISLGFTAIARLHHPPKSRLVLIRPVAIPVAIF